MIEPGDRYLVSVGETVRAFRPELLGREKPKLRATGSAGSAKWVCEGGGARRFAETGRLAYLGWAYSILGWRI